MLAFLSRGMTTAVHDTPGAVSTASTRRLSVGQPKDWAQNRICSTPIQCPIFTWQCPLTEFPIGRESEGTFRGRAILRFIYGGSDIWQYTALIYGGYGRHLLATITSLLVPHACARIQHARESGYGRLAIARACSYEQKHGGGKIPCLQSSV